MNGPSSVSLLTQWAEWGRELVPRRRLRPDWTAVERLIDTAQPFLRSESELLRELLRQSSGQLGFTDPLLCDLGVHRWLDTEREESYSDWLAWALEQLGDDHALVGRTSVRAGL